MSTGRPVGAESVERFNNEEPELAELDFFGKIVAFFPDFFAVFLPILLLYHKPKKVKREGLFECFKNAIFYGWFRISQ